MEHVHTILAHDARELAEALAEVLALISRDGARDLGEVSFTEPLRLRLVRETLSDGSHVYDLKP